MHNILKSPWFYILGIGIFGIGLFNVILAIGLENDLAWWLLGVIGVVVMIVMIASFWLVPNTIRVRLTQQRSADLKGGFLLSLLVIMAFGSVLLNLERYARDIPSSQWLVYYVHPEMRVLMPYPQQSLTDLGWSVPHLVTTNEEGFRDSPITDLTNTTDEISILSLGDSYTFGFAVDDDETYPYFLERELEQILDNRVDVNIYNSGVLWWTIDNQIKVYDYLLSQGYEFDVITLGYFPGNDILELEQNEFLRAALEDDPIPASLMASSALLRWRRYTQFLFGLPLYRNDVEEIRNDLDVDSLAPIYEDYFIELLNRVQENDQQLYVLRIDGPGNYGETSKTGIFITNLTTRYDVPLVTIPYRDEDYLHPLDAHYSAQGNQHVAQAFAEQIASAYQAPNQ